jgi:hypothetical protein
MSLSYLVFINCKRQELGKQEIFRIESTLCNSQLGSLRQVSDFMSLSLGVLICKMRRMRCYEDQMRESMPSLA